MNILNRLKLQGKIFILSSGLILVSLIISTAILSTNLARTLQLELGNRVLAIARTVAQIEEVQENVGKPRGAEVIQPIAEKIRLATDVEYIVVFDMNKTRYSHPLQDRIGKDFSGGDENRALNNHEYISRAEGVLGPSLRAFVPIKVDEGTRQVGVVTVGVLTPTWWQLVVKMKNQLALALLAGLAVGVIGSFFLSENIKQTMFNLEPEEISRLLEERTAVFHSIDDCVVAIDNNERITIINDKAKKILGLDRKESYTGVPIKEVLPNSRLPETLRNGTAEFNQERVVNRTMILANRFPIRVKDKVVGAVSTFKNRTEVQALAEELTGVKNFIEAQRVQNHEYMNQLHTIAGLIYLGRYEEAADFIFSITEEHEEISQFLMTSIADYAVAGLLMAKYSRAQELKIKFTFDRRSRLSRLPKYLHSSSLVVVLGNLIENAFEAVQSLPEEQRCVYCRLYQENKLLQVIVSDKGRGIPPELQDQIFKKGFSTKEGQARGIGLYLVKKHVEAVGGNIVVQNKPGRGTTFTITFPYLDKGIEGGELHGH